MSRYKAYSLIYVNASSMASKITFELYVAPEIKTTSKVCASITALTMSFAGASRPC